MTTLLRAAAKREGALRGKGRSCACCCSYGSTKAGPRNRQIARKQQRQVEKRQWRSDASA